MTLFPSRSFLVRRSASLLEQRLPDSLSAEALKGWLDRLRKNGHSLIGEETGIRIEWSGPHQPLIEASHLDVIRGNYEALCLLLKVALPITIKESGDLAGDTPCYHAWAITQHLRSSGSDGPEQSEKQDGLFEETRDLAGLPLCFCDTETTGLAHEDRVIQLAIMHVDPVGEVTPYQSYFNPEGRKNNGWSVNQISDWKLKNAPLFRSHVQKFHHLLTGKVFVAHNAGFDKRMLTAELLRCGISFAPAAIIDTQKLAKLLWPNAPKHKLEVLAVHLGLQAGKAHDAMGDVQTMMSLWHRICQERPHFTVSQWARLGA